MTKLFRAFQEKVVTLAAAQICPQRKIPYDQRRVLFYKQIAASIDDIGIVEPLVVFPKGAGGYLLLDGHLRLEILIRKGISEVPCILATEDEAYTYNRRVNSISPIAQHLMLLKAVENGLSEERIASALRVDIASIRRKRNMLDGICSEAIDLLQTKKVSVKAFYLLKKMKPSRQIEAAEHMLANSVFSGSFVRALLYATKTELLTDPPRVIRRTSLPEPTKNQFAIESETLLKSLKTLEADLGKEALVLTVFSGYIRRLTSNPKIKRYLERRHADVLSALMEESSIV